MAWRPNESRNVETRIFKETYANIMAADAMVFCITRPSTPMALIIQDNQVLVVAKYWYILATFLWLLKLEWLGHIFVKINYILSLFSLKISVWVIPVGCKGQSILSNTDVLVLYHPCLTQTKTKCLLCELIFLIFSMDREWTVCIWLTTGKGMW